MTERKRAYDRARRRRLFDVNRERELAQQREWRAAHPDLVRRYAREQQRRLKAEVLGNYGDCCACCGETERVFLTLEHIGGTGAQHRKDLGGTTSVYRDLKKRGFPPGFEVLCRNCNWGRHANDGVCPHQESVDACIRSA